MNADKDFYDKGVQPEAIAAFAGDVRHYVDNWLADARVWFEGRTDVRVLELGAGSCTTSLVVSKEPWVAEVVAVDISTARMKQIVPHVLAIFGGDPSKLAYAEMDMNAPLRFDDGHFDLVIMDAALHHSRNIWFTLQEIHRVLKRGGIFVGQREHYVSPATAGWSLRRLLKSEEVLSGVSENAYLKSQYDYYLRAAGFTPRFKAVLPKLLFRALFFLNGVAFSKYNIIAHRNDRAYANPTQPVAA